MKKQLQTLGNTIEKLGAVERNALVGLAETVNSVILTCWAFITNSKPYQILVYQIW